MATVFMTKEITPEAVVRLYEAVGLSLGGKVAVKVHSGEEGNANFLRPAFFRPMIDRVGGTVVECNTAYGGARTTTEKHLRLLKKHGWNDGLRVDLLDAEGPDLVLDIPDGAAIRKNYVGKNLANYDSLLVLSHFKGHAMGGYGGALKQLSIGCASSAGKAWIHSAGYAADPDVIWEHLPEQDQFLEAMADAAASVARRFAGKAVYINVMKNLSVDCDCDGNAAPPCMRDVGILASTDPVAVDRACLDLVEASDDPGRDAFLERVNSRHGTHTIEEAEKRGIGSADYELVVL